MWGLFGLPVGFVVCICCYIWLLYLLLSPTRDGIIYLFILTPWLGVPRFCRAKRLFKEMWGFQNIHFISGPGWDGIIAGGGHNLTGGMGGIFCCQTWRAGRILSDRASSSVLVIAYTSYFCTDEQFFNDWFDKRVISVDLWDWKNALLLAAEKISLSISQPLTL